MAADAESPAPAGKANHGALSTRYMPNASTPSVGGQAAALNLNEQLALISEAQKGISRGWSFTPCRGKDAFRRGWQSEADLPLDQLRRYVSDGCNLGLRCGHGIAVVDIFR
jgi:hypothetical protein